MAGRGALTSISLMCLGAARAVELRAPVKPCEAGWIDRYMAAPLRGQSYLTAHRGRDAALEFQKIVDHRGIVLTSIIGALSQVGLARAFILQGDIPRARAAYENFFRPGRMRTGTYLYWPLPNPNTQASLIIPAH
jgi:hypothetical protein